MDDRASRLVNLSIAALSLVALAGCGSEVEQAPKTNVAEDFASRINGAPEPEQQEEAGAAPNAPAATAPAPAQDGITSPYAQGTENVPAGTICGANLIAGFIGQTADNSVRSQIVASVSSANEVRFIPPGGAGSVTPDAASSRLNLMLDADGVISGAQCG